MIVWEFYRRQRQNSPRMGVTRLPSRPTRKPSLRDQPVSDQTAEPSVTCVVPMCIELKMIALRPSLAHTFSRIPKWDSNLFEIAAKHGVRFVKAECGPQITHFPKCGKFASRAIGGIEVHQHRVRNEYYAERYALSLGQISHFGKNFLRHFPTFFERPPAVD